jgi:hypothetical protein
VFFCIVIQSTLNNKGRVPGMIETVYGVDFSGARLAGRTTWVARMEPTGARRRALRLVALSQAARLCRSPRRPDVLPALVEMIGGSEGALWALNFPFGLPIEVMAEGCRWAGQLEFLAEWGEDAYAAGVECLRRARALGGPWHIRRLTDVEERTPFDPYHYRIIYQTFYGMRHVLGPLRSRAGMAILPFQHRRLARARRVVVEACPASTLKRMGLPHQNYKQPAGGRLTPRRRRTRHAILAGLVGWVEISAGQRLQLMRDGGADGLDAVLAGVGAWRCWREYDHAAVGRHPRYSREGRHYA